MRIVSSLLCGACVALFAVSTAGAATLVPVPPFPGATMTNVFDINNHREITGSYVDAGGVEHGFFGTLDGSYTSFDYGGTSAGTQPRSINDKGYLLGFAPDPSFVFGPEFLRKPNGALITIMKDGQPLDGIAQGLAAHQVSVGDYFSSDLTQKNAYRAKNGNYLADIDLGLTGVTRTSARDITAHGDIDGFYVQSGVTHGFILSGGVTQTVDADASGTTTLEGLNEKGIATGQVQDGSGNSHAFVLDTDTNTVTWIDVPGSTNQQAWGINKQGLVAVSTDIGSYIYCPLKQAHRCPSGGTAIKERRTHLKAQRAMHRVVGETRHGLVP